MQSSPCRSKFLCCLLIPIFLFSVTCARAADQDAWLADKAVISKTPSLSDKNATDKRCDLVWEKLWPWAKKGNLEARSFLLQDYIMSGRVFPGHEDRVSIERDLVILLAYTWTSDNVEFQEITQYLPDYLSNDKHHLDDLFSCKKGHQGKKCVEKAIKAKLVPTFENFASEIDFQLTNGKKSECRGGMSSAGDPKPVGKSK